MKITIKDIFKNIAFLLASLISAFSSCAALMYYFDDTLKFVDDLPETPTAAVLGGYVAMVFGAILHIFIMVIFIIFIFSPKAKIEPRLFFFQKDEWLSCRVWRVIGYIVIAMFLYMGIKDLIVYKEFFLNGLWYYASSILTAALYLVIWESIWKSILNMGSNQ